MNTVKLEFQIPEDILLALNEQSEAMIKQMLFLYAVKMFELKKLSLGKASELAGIKKWEFMNKLSEMNIPVINYKHEELKEELQYLKESQDK